MANSIKHLLDKLFGSKVPESISYPDFKKWLDKALNKPIPEEVIAFNFNLYEDLNKTWSVELVGTDNFDMDDEDCACDEVSDFDTRSNPLKWRADIDYEKVTETLIPYIERYLEEGNYSSSLKDAKGIGIGFVSGNLEIVYSR